MSKMPFCCEHPPGGANTVLRGPRRITRLAGILAGILFCVLIHQPVRAAIIPAPATYGLTLAWNPSPSPEIVACHLYYGTVSGQYTNTVVVGNVTNVTVSGLLIGVTYYFAITAIDAQGQESDYSNEISYRQDLSQPALPGAQLQIRGGPGGPVVLTVTGPAGQTFDIEATGDFTTWTVIGTVTLDAGGAANFTDPNAANFSQRFYRARASQPAGQPPPPAQLQIRNVPGGQFVLTLAGSAGHAYDIEATEDFTTWTVIGTVTLAVGGTLDFTDSDAPNHSQRFYRTRDTQP